MKEKSNAKSLDNGASPRGCERSEELVAYLYGEAAPREAKAFRRHLDACAVCREELAAFGAVREAVGEWRAEALSTVPSLNLEEELSPALSPRLGHALRRSAAAALREFFSLSPLWLQAGSVAALLVVCALAALTFARTEVRWDSNGLAFRTGVREHLTERLVPVTAQAGYTQEQVNAIVKENVEREVAAEHAKWEAENQRANVLEAALKQQKSAARSANILASQRGPQRPASGRSRSPQLAEVDPFSTREERVPRLTDLLDAVDAPR